MAIARKPKLDNTFKGVAALLSAGAALVSILSFVASRHESQTAELAAGLAAVEVSRITLAPAVDTAYSLGDTVQFTTLAADAHGQALHAAAVHWTVDDPAVAEVDSAGQVVARGPGATTVTVAIGGRAGRARIVVRPRLTALAIVSDTVLLIAEGVTLELRAMGSDARGNWHRPERVTWGGGDADVAVIDTMGTLRAVAPGVTKISAVSAGLAAERRVLVTPVPASITLAAGAAQRTAAGQRLPAAVAVQVVSRSGRPVAGVEVLFEPSPAMGEVDPDRTTTDSLGIAASRWTLGSVPGRQRLAVEVVGIDSALVVTAEADPTPGNTRITLQSDSIVAEAGTSLDEPITIQVSDSGAVALSDIPVAWTALDGGSFSQTDARTDSMGVAHAHWRLGPRAGRQRARVQIGNPRSLPPFALSARAVAGSVTSIDVVSGEAQRGMVGSVLARAVVIRAMDSLGNPVSGVPIRLTPQTGTVDSMVPTGADGKASVRWTLGNTAGPVRLVARLDAGDDSAVVTATARPGAAKTLYFAVAPASGTAGRALPKPVQVVVRDRFGNPVPKVAVSFTAVAGKVAPSHGVTDAAGRAATTWTLGPKRGKQLLTASVKSPPLRVSHIIEAGPHRPGPKTGGKQ
jgi:hypothetical protein